MIYMKRMGIFVAVVVFMVGSVSITPSVQAASKTKTVVKKTAVADVSVSPSVGRDGKSISVYFANLQKTSSLAYTLSYLTNGKPEGAGGSINTKGKFSLSRTLLLGTCSSGVCRYHTNIANAQLTVTITYKDGRTVTRTYPLKIGRTVVKKIVPVKKITTKLKTPTRVPTKKR